MQYPVIAATNPDTYAGTVDNNLQTGTAYVEVASAATGTRCRGAGHLTSEGWASCKGREGKCSLTCDDGRQITCEYKLASCTSGMGVGRDQNQTWIIFAFGPALNDAASARTVAAKLKTIAGKLAANAPKHRGKEAISTGTGFFVSTNGYLVTADHVVASSKNVEIVTRSGDALPAAIVGVDPANDVALLKAQVSARPLRIALSSTVAVGESVLTIGYPLISAEGQGQKATFGHINALSGQNDVRFLQTDAEIEGGNSGGPLLDSEGRVIGVIDAKLDPIKTLKLTGWMPDNVTYAVKSDYILPLLTQYGLDEMARQKKGTPETDADIVRQVQDSIVLVIAEEHSQPSASNR